MVERFWPGATSDAVRRSVAQLQTTCREMASDGIHIRYLGATFVPIDESLSCRFDGTEQAVRAAYELAGATFDRLVMIQELDPEMAPQKEDQA
ncbi:MAG: hypothetical protein JWN62_4071 [Acidimicrobiales bacterium]|nr:hypothetical protein [Acidimicrobiales bacterium]